MDLSVSLGASHDAELTTGSRATLVALLSRMHLAGSYAAVPGREPARLAIGIPIWGPQL